MEHIKRQIYLYFLNIKSISFNFKEQLKKKLITTFIDEKTLKTLEIEETKKIQKEIQNKASIEAMTNIENKLKKDLIHD